MSSSGSPPSRQQRLEEEQAEDESQGSPEEGERGGEMSGEGSQHVQGGARPRVPPSDARGRVRGGGRQRGSQRRPDGESDVEEAGFDVDLLIDLVHERQPLWSMQDHRHADAVVTRRLWDQIAGIMLDGWDRLDTRAQNNARTRLITRWRSLRDRFRRELNVEMQAPSGSGKRKGSKYKYAEALAFLRSSMISRRTFCSTTEPAAVQPPPETMTEETVTGAPSNSPCDPSLPSTSTSDSSLPSTSTADPSLPSTSTSFPSTSTSSTSLPSIPSFPTAYWQTSVHAAAAQQRVGVPLTNPLDASDTRTTFGSVRQRPRGLDRGSPEILALNASIHSLMKVLSEQIIAGFQLISHSLHELSSKMDLMRSELRPTQHYFQSIVGQLENLTSEQQLYVMQACQDALCRVRYLSSLNLPTTLPPHPPAYTVPPQPPAPTLPPAPTVPPQTAPLTTPHPASTTQPPQPAAPTHQTSAQFQPSGHYPSSVQYHSAMQNPTSMPAYHQHSIQSYVPSPSPLSSQQMSAPTPSPSSMSAPPTTHFTNRHSVSVPLLPQNPPYPSPQPSPIPQPSPSPHQYSVSPNPFVLNNSLTFATPSHSVLPSAQPSPSLSSLHTPSVEGGSPASLTSVISTPRTYENL
ncbi:uncharacterized protein ACNLHF_022405 [Anomaloglossus baeobatrachus]|uniref:uncharacterized protein LOC142259313 n=1 Tax=Anomaloglossus baeobatrachus TaxID=238106 RepID=UPI003F4F8637